MQQRIWNTLVLIFTTGLLTCSYAQVRITPEGIGNGQESGINSNEIEFREGSFQGEIDLLSDGRLGFLAGPGGGSSFGYQMYLTQQGRLGLGVANPSLGLLEIEGNSSPGFGQLALVENEVDYARIIFQTPGGGDDDRWEIAGRTDFDFDRLNFYHTDAGDLLSLNGEEGGRVGIGTINPEERFHLVDGNVLIEDGIATIRDFAPKFAFESEGGDETFQIVSFLGAVEIANEFTGSTADLILSTEGTTLKLEDDGQVGIETNNPAQTLSVNGSAGKPGGGPWSTFSDRRLKTNIRPYKDGMEQILAIEPVFYQYTGKAELPTDREYVGIIAQDMQKVAPYMVEPLTYESETEQGTYLSYDGTALPYMLVNAIKELHEDNKEKDQRIADLEEQIQEMNDLRDRLDQLEALLSGQSEDETPVILNSDRASLEQNIPNPFRGVTRINYFLPEGTQRATLLVHDMQGRELQRIPLQNTGRGQLDLQTRNLTAGTYSYSLYVDGARIDSRKMVVEQ